MDIARTFKDIELPHRWKILFYQTAEILKYDGQSSDKADELALASVAWLMRKAGVGKVLTNAERK